jgi:hypothetical protein
MILAEIGDGSLDLQGWAVLIGMLSFIFGTVGWGVYRALLADKKQKAVAQQAFKSE